MLIEPQDGNWYIVATCENCNSTIFLVRDLNEGRGSLNAAYGVTCPQCNHKGFYEGRHYKHSSGPSEVES